MSLGARAKSTRKQLSKALISIQVGGASRGRCPRSAPTAVQQLAKAGSTCWGAWTETADAAIR